MVTSPLAVLASDDQDAVSNQAHKDAESLILKRVDRPEKAEIEKSGSDYAKAFWQYYDQKTQQFIKYYHRGFRDGVLDKEQATFDDDFLNQAYQAGRKDALQDRHHHQPVNSNEGGDDNGRSDNRGPATPPSPASGDVTETEAPITQQPSSPSTSPSTETPAPDPGTANSPAVSSDEVPLSPVKVGVTGRKFIKKLAPLAQEVGRQYDLYPSVILAQAALESNWGRSELAHQHHNLFGVKAITGVPSVTMPTTECDDHGHPHLERAKFRKYQDDREAVLDYANTLSDPLYNGVHRKEAHTWRAATAALKGKYATDPHYDAKLNAIIRGAHLDRYDSVNKQAKASHHWGRIATKAAAPVKHAARHHDSHAKHDHSQLAAVGILGGAGSFSLWGFFRHLFGA